MEFLFFSQDGYGSYRHSAILKIFPNSNETSNITVNYLGKWNWPFLDVFLMTKANETVKDVTFGLTFKVRVILKGR